MQESTRESAGDVSVSLCGPEDRAEQVALYELCFDREDGRRVLDWRYDQGPHGPAVSFLTRDPARGSGSVGSPDAVGGALAGYACSPRRVVARGEEASLALVGETGDVMTHPEARGRGLFSDLDRRAMEETARRGWPVVFGLPNRRSDRLFVEKLGWKEVGRVRPWTFVLAVDAGARHERLRAGRLAAWGVPWAAWCGVRARGRLRDAAFGHTNTVAIPRFDERVDAVTRAVESRFPWMTRRDHAWLNWRFFDAPSGLFRAHGVYLPSGEMVGYAVVQLPREGEAVGYLVDMVGVDAKARAAAVDSALGHLAKAGASVARATAIEGSWWEGRLRRAGFRPGKRQDFKLVIAYVHDAEHPLGRAALEPASWYFTDADRDDETVS
jgi:GNAT superfamily N-acetyltransferase